LATLPPKPGRGVKSCENQFKAMPSTHKKVIVRKMGRDSLSGYVSPAHFAAEGKLELLNTSGKLVQVDLAEIKSVDFVRDFADAGGPSRKTFTTRPRTEGLWVRLKFTDNDILEGIMPNDLNQIAAEGYLLTPPDTRGNVQRIFIPKSALEEINVLAVIGHAQARRKRAEDTQQEKLFTE
jgi:hypothetical protein